MRRRSLARRIRKNWKFVIGVVVLSVIVGTGAALLSVQVQRLQVELQHLELYDRALSDPEKLTVKEKADLQQWYETLPPPTKSRPRKEFSLPRRI